MSAVLTLELKWQDMALRREVFGVLWILRDQMPDRPFVENARDDNMPGMIRVDWPIDDVSDGDQLQRRVGDILDACGWGRQLTALVQLGHFEPS